MPPLEVAFVYLPIKWKVMFFLHLTLFACTALIFSALRCVGKSAHYLHTICHNLHIICTLLARSMCILHTPCTACTALVCTQHIGTCASAL